MSPTNELTIAPNAAPIMTPMARSTTLPRSANFLNSSSIVPLNPHRPHPEEAHRSRVYPRSAYQVRKSATADLRCAVSKDGRWLGLACGPSFETRAILRGARPILRGARPSARAPQDDGGTRASG